MMTDQSSMDRLERCVSKADFALWVLTESDSAIRHVYDDVREVFEEHDFDDGYNAVIARILAMDSQRLPDGGLPQSVLMRLEEQKSRMREVVSRGQL